ncbi:MAG: 50S ribosomal protein L24 [Candidatus Saccharibacteria bacterium]|nr:50S ribosomal protein L24 [Candidatus Saccharibacteria bacterium]
MSKIFKIKLKKGDNVMVRAGKHKGKTGKVAEVHPKLNAVTVEGINIVKKHQKPNRAHPQGGILEITKPIAVSKVAIVEPTSKKPSKIGFKVDEEGNKVRIYKRTGKEIR